MFAIGKSFYSGLAGKCGPDFLLSLHRGVISHIFIIVFPGFVERYGPDFHFRADFRPLKGEDGTTYHL